MYPRNSASPEPIAIGPVILIADGTVQTSGVTVRIKPIGVAEGDGVGTTAYSTDGIVLYTPTQAETNYTSFVLIAKKASCIPASITIITTASATPGTVLLAPVTHTSAVVPTVSAVTGSVGSVTGNVGGSVDSVTGAVGSVTAPVTVGTNSDKTGYSLTATTGLGNQTADITGSLSGSVGSVTGSVGSVTAGVTVTTNSDKTGYSLLATTGLGNQTANITGNLSGSVGSVTGNLGGSVGSVVGAVGSVTDAVTITGDLSVTMKESVNAEIDAALVDIHLDHLFATDYDPAAKPGTATALLNELIESDAGVSRFTANALEQAPSGGGGTADWTADEKEQLRHRLGIDGTKSAPASSNPNYGTLTANITGNLSGSVGSVNNAIQTYSVLSGSTVLITIDNPTGDLAVIGFYEGSLLVWTDASTGTIQPRWITGHTIVGGDARLDLHAALSFTPAAGDTVQIYRDVRWTANATHAAGTAWNSGAITAASIASNAITSAKIADETLTASKFSTALSGLWTNLIAMITGSGVTAAFTETAVENVATAGLTPEQITEISESVATEVVEQIGTSSVNVLPAVGIVADRSPGVSLTPVVGETILQSITLYATDGTTPVSLAGKTLAIPFETMSGIDIAVIANADITVSGTDSNVVTFAYPSAVTASERTLRFAIKDAAAPLTEYLKGICVVTSGPRVDA